MSPLPKGSRLSCTPAMRSRGVDTKARMIRACGCAAVAACNDPEVAQMAMGACSG